MNKQQLIESLADTLKHENLTKVQIECTLNALITTITKQVKKGDDVKFVGFGTFTKVKRKARTGRNPQTGATLKLPASWNMKFRVSQEIKSQFN